ncbi:helix-turn-helix transcriptional regulator [Ureibacillus acetophenoni]|uniref:Predicted transcriptional regulator YheO n=1 Tax=Ureibacillus acetophenoni TaxID=614649 RepID=A0A285UMT9_9BACL|nr:PAS domain-containing protein [Ureibacillus acetophenoni]SOC43149.1 predicted transcriptional regulator YheO [Ureibacillus acetophenoni]
MDSIVQQYIPMADVIAKTFGSDVEVVIHDLTIPQNSVVYTVNNHVTGRQVGQSFNHLITDVLLSQNFTNDYSANYYFHTDDGRLIKSSTVLIRDHDKKVKGALCINVDTTKITQSINYLTSLLPQVPNNGPDPTPQFEDTSKMDHINEIANDLIDKTIGNKSVDSLRREEKIEMIRFMEQKGIFLIRGTIERVAEKLKISKVTVYSYIDEIKEKYNKG